jgi:3-deoxy-7-phosphoheptulonate synthase
MFNALHAAQQPQNFLFNGSEVETSSNPLAHVILRGATNEYGKNIPNYYYENLLETIESYKSGTFKNPFIMIDTNHDNSGKQYMEQMRIVKQTLINRSWNEEVAEYVRGFMIESYLEDGRQEPDGNVFGKSITDPCLGWEKTESLVKYIFENA